MNLSVMDQKLFNNLKAMVALGITSLQGMLSLCLILGAATNSRRFQAKPLSHHGKVKTVMDTYLEVW